MESSRYRTDSSTMVELTAMYTDNPNPQQTESPRTPYLLFLPSIKSSTSTSNDHYSDSMDKGSAEEKKTTTNETNTHEQTNDSNKGKGISRLS